MCCFFLAPSHSPEEVCTHWKLHNVQTCIRKHATYDFATRVVYTRCSHITERYSHLTNTHSTVAMPIHRFNQIHAANIFWWICVYCWYDCCCFGVSVWHFHQSVWVKTKTTNICWFSFRFDSSTIHFYPLSLSLPPLYTSAIPDLNSWHVDFAVLYIWIWLLSLSWVYWAALRYHSSHWMHMKPNWIRSDCISSCFPFSTSLFPKLATIPNEWAVKECSAISFMAFRLR